MSEDVLLVEDKQVEGSSPEGGVISVWTLNRPSKLNALNAKSHELLKSACSRAEADDNIRVVVIRGAAPLPAPEGKRPKPAAFAAGADISEFAGKSSDDVLPFFEDNAWDRVWNLTKPTIAMVDGFALGGGTELALSCDMRVASDRAKFGTPEINLGLIPGGGGTQRLCSILGYGKAMEMVMSGEMVGADEALRLGLANKVASPDELESVTMALAENIARKSPYTIKVAKRSVRAALDLPMSEGILTERSEFVALFDTEDKEIGVSAFLERKSADWVGR
ncbi:MAG: enoyl-CoA hydratase/isomerase family protein [Euryarchaeota archaeon]|jgi:enoyl-CoA hydratase/carnithine racemase|nr:enoyl-CoA hydratase/isomerase family protein [Euryarchaeota archaeon]MBT3653559.1 enoyl-CoA hydratase/isomerase family protein [Euryarchaeota archaeon]MBT3757663.1 enoyl-CoA hydratase/isomerase family protein [Euryarchaeota archaeon]MBT4050943.1 enoyl-CoA hydratase/isomerase family protein [Euryarchaeota archaeon]MBT4346246.1 enoyl-CoA hydratase/isomerase family protein [Euryarchaeota archaeon]|tara:strand:- start:672 stop:1508 length:837 start_codon:yes stop_codon:yes gene_type:complete